MLLTCCTYARGLQRIRLGLQAVAVCRVARYRVQDRSCAVSSSRYRFALAASLISLATASPLIAQTTAVPQPGAARTAPAASIADDEFATLAEAPWLETVRKALVLERFDELDRLAEGYRTQATRMPGGDWTLHVLYAALNGPHGSDTTMPDHLAHLEHWIKAKPQSVTAAVAYAGSLTRWAWQARGTGQAETVTLDGWMTFGARLSMAKNALDAVPGAATRTVRDPQWYAAYMTVALGLDWKNDQMKTLFEQASAAYPNYFYLYKQYAKYLLPKWEGKPGDAAFFAKSAADSLSGSEGDMLYYQIGTTLLSRGNSSFQHRTLDWQRLQRGHTASVSKYGDTRRMENEFGLMAYREKDAAVAQQQFAVIGDRWSKSVWRDRIYFDRARDWAGTAQAGTTPSAAGGLIPMGPQ